MSDPKDNKKQKWTKEKDSAFSCSAQSSCSVSKRVTMSFSAEDLNLLFTECAVNSECCCDLKLQAQYRKLAGRFSKAEMKLKQNAKG